MKVSHGCGIVHWAGTDVVADVQVPGVLLQSDYVSLLSPLIIKFSHEER